MRRVGEHAVIAPVPITGKSADRHQFDRGDAEIGEPRERGGNAAETAKGADMEFVEYAVGEWPTLPIRVPPTIGVWIGHDGVAEDASAQRTGGRIHDRELFIDAE